MKVTSHTRVHRLYHYSTLRILSVLFVVCFCSVFSLVLPSSVSAVAKVWSGLGADNNWSTSDNWSPVGAPATTDTVTFNGTSTKDATIDALANASVSTFAMSAGYTGTVTLARSFSMTSTFTQAAGIFSASNQTLSITSTFSLSGGTFQASSGTTTISGAFSVSGGTFTHNSGTVIFSGGAVTLSCGSVLFNLVSFAGQTGIKTVNSTCSLPLGLNPTVPNGILLNGTLSGSGTLTQTTGQMNMQSTGVLSGFTGLTGTSNSIRLNGATLDASGYSVFSVPSGFTINSSGTFTAPSGTMSVGISFDISPGTFIHNSGTVNINGSAGGVNCNSQTLNLVTFTGQTGTKTINANCTLPLGPDPVIPNSLTLSGTLTGSGTLTQTTGTLILNTGSALTGFSGLTGTSNILNVNGATVNFGTYSPFSIAGTTTVGNGSVTFPSGAVLTGGLTVSGGTVNTTTGSFSVGGTLALSSGTLNAPTGTLTLSGAVSFSGTGTFNHNSGTLALNGGTVSHSCNNKTFNLVTFSITAAQTIGSTCSFPVGASPTIPFGLSVSGSLVGTGTLTMSSGTLTLNSGGSLSGFSSLAVTAFTNAGATADLSGYTSFSASDTVTVSSGTLTLPAGASLSGAFTLSGGTLAATSGNITIGGTVTITTGVMNAPTGTLSVGGNFAHTSGTFTHNSGTVVFNGGSQIISGTATTFNNFTKTLSSATAQTLTFPSGSLNTQTILGTLTLNGYDSSNRLLLRSSSTGTQWRLDAQGSRSLLYLDVRDGNNINASPMQMGGTGSLDSTNNTSWNFSSVTPNVPSSLGPSESISGGYTTTLHPVFSFSLTDSNPLDTVKYTINISTHSDFSSPIVDFTSAFFSQGTSSFTVGQSTSGGVYTVGSVGQSLTSADYYWRVNATDVNGLSSAYTSANGGAVAFKIDSVPPNAFTPTLNVTSPTTNTTPTITFSTTDDVAIDHYTVRHELSSASTQTSPYVLPPLSIGSHTLTVRAYDTSLNYTEGVVSVTIVAPSADPTPTPTPTTSSSSSESGSSSSSTSTSQSGPNCNPGWSSCTSVDLTTNGAEILTPNGGFSSVYIGSDATNMDLTVVLEEFGWQVIGTTGYPTIPPWSQGLNSPGLLTKLTITSAFNGYQVTSLDRPMRIILPYDPAKLGQIPPSSLRLARFDQSNNRWITIDRNTVVDTQSNAVSNTSLFPGFYTVIYVSEQDAGPSDPASFVGASPSAILQTDSPPENTVDTPEQRQAVIDEITNERRPMDRILGIITTIATSTEVVVRQTVTVIKTIAPITPVALSAVVVTTTVGTVALQSGVSLWPKILVKILQSLGLIPRGKPQGIIYDSQTYRPVPFAMLTITSVDQSIQETTISDVYGIYGGIRLARGQYQLTVIHQDYTFPAKSSNWGHMHPNEIWRGGAFDVHSENQEQLFAIPVDPRTNQEKTSFHWRLFSKIVLQRLQPHMQKLLWLLSSVSLVMTALSPSAHNLAVTMLYGIVLAKNVLQQLRRPLVSGSITNSSGQPLENVIVKVVAAGTNQLVSLTQSDATGRFVSYIRPGKYQLSFIKEGYIWEKYAQSMGLEEVTLNEPTSYTVTLTAVENIT